MNSLESHRPRHGTTTSGYEDDERNRSRADHDDKQVSVLAGTGPDANRVAYVKTVRPDSQQQSQQPEDFEYQTDDTFDEPNEVNVSVTKVTKRPKSGKSKNKKREEDPDHQGNTSVTVADISHSSAHRTFDDEEELPPYPEFRQESDSVANRSSFPSASNRSSFPSEQPSEEAAEVKPKRKPKPATAPKKKKTTVKTTVQSNEDGTTTITEYKTERNGVIDTRMEKNITVPIHETDIDHDLALAEAIQTVTDVNTDMNVEKIEIKTKPKKPKKPKKAVAS